MRREAGTMTVAGRALEFVWLGPRPDEAATMVLLHEGLGCVSMWRDFPDRLAERTGLGVLVYSRAGYGRSDPAVLPRPLSYMHDEGIDVLPAILDHWALRSVFTVGHSDGGSIAAIHAGATRDPRLRGLVLMAPHFFVEPMGIDSIARAKVAYETTDLRERLARHHGDNVDCAFRGWNDAWLDPGFRDWTIEAYPPRIEVPVLVLQGTQDEYGSALQLEAARRLCGGPVETKLFESCGHSAHRDRPEETLAAIAAFTAFTANG